MTRPPLPSDLGAEGRRLWRAVRAWLAAQDLILDPHEAPLIAELGRSLDRLATLRAALDTLDVTDPAWTRLAAEERQQRLAYARLLSAVGLPSGIAPPVDVGLTPRSRRAQKAANARWARRDDVVGRAF